MAVSSQRLQYTQWEKVESSPGAQAQHTVPAANSIAPRVTPGYLHGQLVRSSFKKQLTLVQALLHGFIIVTLVLGLMQAVRAVGAGGLKLVDLLQKQPLSQAYYQDVVDTQQTYTLEIQRLSTETGVEELARNQLNYVGPKEVLVRYYPD